MAWLGVWNCIFSGFGFQFSEPEIWRKSLFLSAEFQGFPWNSEKDFSDSVPAAKQHEILNSVFLGTRPTLQNWSRPIRLFGLLKRWPLTVTYMVCMIESSRGAPQIWEADWSTLLFVQSSQVNMLNEPLVRNWATASEFHHNTGVSKNKFKMRLPLKRQKLASVVPHQKPKVGGDDNFWFPPSNMEAHPLPSSTSCLSNDTPTSHQQFEWLSESFSTHIALRQGKAEHLGLLSSKDTYQAIRSGNGN